MAAKTPEPTLRGREPELRELSQAVDRALSGQLASVLIEGETGIGKTRLLTETLRVADASGCRVATAKADELQQTRPFAVLADALGCVRSAPDPRRRAIAELLATHARDAQGAITVSSDPGLRFRAVDAFSDLVEALARQQPLAIGLDDLQWADPSSLLTLAAIGRAAIGLPVLLVACYRSFPRSEPLDRSVESLGSGGAVRLSLGGLAEQDVQAVVAETLGAEPGARLLAQAAAAAGNPMYLIELLTSITRPGAPTSDDEQAATTAGSLPPSLSLIILHRLSALPEETRHALRVGSLLGSSFSATELAAVTARPVADLAPALEAALDAGVLDDDGLRLRFRHDLIRDAIYADLPTSLRMSMHRDAATRLTGIGTPITRVAEQYARGATSGDTEAIDWLTRAARETSDTSPETAADLLERAADLMTSADPRRDLLLAERADSLMLAGRVEDAVTACQSLLDRSHHPDADAPTRLRLGAALLVNGRPVDALRELDTVTRSLASTKAQRANGLSEAATARLWTGDFDGAESSSEQAYPLATETGGSRLATAALATRSVVACMRGQMARARRLSDQALDLADRSPGRAGHGYPVYATRGWIMMELDQEERARQAFDSGRQLCEELGVRWPLATYQAYLAVARFTAGQWDDVAAELEAGIGFAEETGVTYALKPSYAALALIRLHRGDLPGAHAAAGRAEAIGDRGSRLFDYRVLWARALLLEAEGDSGRALEELADRWGLCRDAGMAIDYPVVGPDLVRLARSLGDTELAEQVTAAVIEVASANQVPWMTGAALRCQGLLTGSPETMTRAIDAYAAGPRRLELALACEEAADLIARRGEVEPARAVLHRAAGIFEQLGATRCQVRVDAELRRLGERPGRRGPRGRPDSGWASLTPSEGSIADLVAEGLTNPQIAGRLYVSRRTVQTHVSHIFTKLGIASRTQLAAQVTRRHQEAPGAG